MSAYDRLAALYEEWRLMTESEGDAIRSQAWQRVEECQHAKATLRERIVEVLSAAGQGGPPAEELCRQLRPLLEHLIGLETRNNDWLAAGRRRLEQEQSELNRSRHAIRQVRGSYGAAVPFTN